MTRADKRDEALDGLLRQSLTSPEGDATPACLDVETLAAWMDGGLKGAALELAQAHAAGCARCRAMVAAMVRTEAAGVVVPGVDARKPARLGWLAWAVPLSAAAAAVVVWIAVPGQRQMTTMAPALERQAAATEPAVPPAELDDLREAAPTTRLEEQRAEPAETVAAAPPPTVALEARADAARDQAAAQSSGFASAPQAQTAVGALRARAAASDEAAAKEGNIEWRLSGPTVERSADGGASWAPAFTGDQELTAASAVSPSAVWVVGRAGTVLVSTDGRSFMRVAFPEMVDLQAVEAADARSAAVTTADGRVFATQDAGRTWARR